MNEAWTSDAKIDTNDDSSNENNIEDKIDSDIWGEVEDDTLPSGNLDTLLVPQDITDEARRVFSVASAKGSSPISIFMDKHAEELAFPSLFCGKARPDHKDRQVKGSPHIHMLVWTEVAPILDETKESEVDVLRFVDEHVTCCHDDSIGSLVSLQQHAHSRTCQERNKKECRFGFPLPPMPETSILQPLEPETNEDDRKIYKKNWEENQEKPR